ncbi:MAG: cupin domain-containing protein [Anaerolineae bacterium]|nr:cupin domain-containing protein [Anaerolineae bacterium]
MKVQFYTDTPAEPAEVPGVGIRWVVGKKDGAPNFAMRVIEVQPGSNTPYHTHDFEHEVYVLEGTGVIRSPQGDQPVEPGTVVYVAPNEEHGFFNQGDGVLRFICVVPHVG